MTARPTTPRLTLETILDANGAGAVVANYVRLLELVKDGGRVAGAEIRDERGDGRYIIRARVVFNATGPWVG